MPLIGLIDGEPLPVPVAREPEVEPFAALPIVLMLALFAAPVFRRLLGSLFGSLALGAGAGFIVWLVSSVLFASLLAGAHGVRAGVDGHRRQRRALGVARRALGRSDAGRFRRRAAAAASAAAVAASAAAARREVGSVRVLPHLLLPRSALHRRFPSHALTAIEDAIEASEKTHQRRDSDRDRGRHRAEGLVAHCARRASARSRCSRSSASGTRARATACSSTSCSPSATSRSSPTAVSTARVEDAEWQRVCTVIEREFAAGRWRDGVLRGIEAVSVLLTREFPAAGPNRNEQLDRPAVL